MTGISDSNYHAPDCPFHPQDFEHDGYSPRKRLPIPDLRPEQMYLKRIQNCIHIEPLMKAKGRDVAVVETDDRDFVASAHVTPLINASQQIVQVDWGKVLYVTFRDQVMMPLLQGMLWGIVGTYYRPFVAYARASLHASAAATHPAEGEGVSWLRTWLRRLGLSSITVGPPSF